MTERESSIIYGALSRLLTKQTIEQAGYTAEEVEQFTMLRDKFKSGGEYDGGSGGHRDIL